MQKSSIPSTPCRIVFGDTSFLSAYPITIETTYGTSSFDPNSSISQNCFFRSARTIVSFTPLCPWNKEHFNELFSHANLLPGTSLRRTITKPLKIIQQDKDTLLFDHAYLIEQPSIQFNKTLALGELTFLCLRSPTILPPENPIIQPMVSISQIPLLNTGPAQLVINSFEYPDPVSLKIEFESKTQSIESSIHSIINTQLIHHNARIHIEFLPNQKIPQAVLPKPIPGASIKSFASSLKINSEHFCFTAKHAFCANIKKLPKNHLLLETVSDFRNPHYSLTLNTQS